MPFKTPTSAVFLQNFRGWNRVEPRSRADDFAKGLETGVADPLWMLGRQWQTAELKGEDAGTPISVSLDHETVTLTHIKLGETSVPTELDFVPPEVLVEREAVPWDWRLRLRVGQHFERLLRLKYPGSAQALIDRARELYSITAPEPPSQDWLETDYASLRFALLLDGRAIDGMVLMEKARSGELQLIAPGGVVDDLIAWFDKLFSQPPAGTSTAWRPERLDYRFELGASASPSGQELVADSCRNGSIDWHTFSQADIGSVNFTQKPTEHPTPTHASFPGMPNRRWWQFEDGAVTFCDLDVAKTDLAKLALLEFALVFGDDWFVVPLRVDPNTLVRVTRLTVTDCFGVTTPINSARDINAIDPTQSWQVYALTGTDARGASADLLYITPAAKLREESPPVEVLKFLRDESANMCFAVEHLVPNQLGDPVRGFHAHLELLRRRRAVEPSVPAVQPFAAPDVGRLPAPTLDYVLATKIPENWVPFVPYDAQPVYNGSGPQRSVTLRRADMVTTDAGLESLRISALSRLLNNNGNSLEWVAEQAIGREGAQVELRRQRVRSVKGETFVWFGRTVKVGQGEGKSGLAFDVAKGRG